MFQALCKRRNVRIKYNRYANAQTAAAVYNVNRSSEDAPIVTPMDFVRDDKDQRERNRIRELQRVIKQNIGGLPSGLSREKILEIRAKQIENLKALGHADAEEIFDDCWPSLKPEEGKP